MEYENSTKAISLVHKFMTFIKRISRTQGENRCDWAVSASRVMWLNVRLTLHVSMQVTWVPFAKSWAFALHFEQTVTVKKSPSIRSMEMIPACANPLHHPCDNISGDCARPFKMSLHTLA